MIALNINLEKTLAKKINLMLNYYGGYCMSEVNENCTHAIVTSYNEAIFENLKKITNEKIKFITPDWIIDCIDTNSLIDETIYNPKYLTTNAELIQKIKIMLINHMLNLEIMYLKLIIFLIKMQHNCPSLQIKG